MSTDQNNGVTIWRMAGGDRSRCGLSTHALSETPKLVQTLNASGTVTTSPVFSPDGTVFIADRAGGVGAYDQDGDLLWRRDLPGGFQASPAINEDGSVVFLGSLRGRVHALDASSGKTIWEELLPAKRDRRIQADLLYLDESDAVITSSWGEKFVSLSGKDGAKLDEWEAGGNPRTAMSANSDGALFGARIMWAKRTNRIEVFKSSIGDDDTVLYQKTIKGNVNAFASPVVWRDGVIVPLNGQTSCQLEYFDQNKSESNKLIQFNRCIHATPSVLNDGVDKLVFATMNGDTCVLPIYGDMGDSINVSSSHDPDEYFLAGSVCDANGYAYLGSPLGFLYRFDSSNTKAVLFETNRAFEAQPAISPNGRLYAPNTDGNVYVFG